MKLKVIVFALLTLVLATTSAWGQITSSMGHVVEPQDVWSGAYENLTDSTAVVWTHRFQASDPDAPWIRIHFGQFDVERRDFVRFTSVDDPARTYDVEGREVWPRLVWADEAQYFSLFFNGDAVDVELHARPGSSGDGVHIDYIHVGTAPDEGGYDGPCLPDFRASYDNRVGRLIAYKDTPLANGNHYIVCSGTLLFPGNCILTANSCLYDVIFSSNHVIVEFNVPLSAPNPNLGALQHPSPEDQFRLLTGSLCTGALTYLQNPAVFRLRPNEKTGRNPGWTYGDPWWYSGPQLTEPVGGELVMQRGYPEFWGPTRHTQHEDCPYITCDGGHEIDAPIGGDGGFSHSAQPGGYGSEGAAIIEYSFPDPEDEKDRLLYGIHTYHDIIGLCLGHQGVGFRADALRPHSEASCVYQVCNQASEYPKFCMTLTGDPCPRPVRAEMLLSLPTMTLDLDLTGILRERGGPPVLSGDNVFEIDTEIVSLEMTANTSHGLVTVRLNPALPSTGQIQQPDTLGLFPADSFFDVFVAIDVGGMVLQNQDPIHMFSSINSIPAYGDMYMGPTGGIQLYSAGNPAGTLQFFSYVLDPEQNCFAANATLQTDAFGTLVGGGTAEIQRDATAWDDTTMTWQNTTEIATMDFQGTNTVAGNFIVRESSTLRSMGKIGFPFAEEAFPAESFFDVFFEIEFPDLSITVYNQVPVRIQATINGFPPTGDVYQDQGPVALYDISTDSQVATLLATSLSPGSPFTCGQPGVGVGDHYRGTPAVRFYPAFPNPASAAVRIAFELKAGGMTRLSVYDVAGRLVRKLADRPFPGRTRHELIWDGSDDQGRRVATGIYFLRLEAEGQTLTRKAILIR